MCRSRSEEGVATVLLLLLTPALFGLAGLVLDGGAALAARQDAADLAEQAARAGADRLDTSQLRSTGTPAIDRTAAQTRACAFVTTVQPEATCTATFTTGAGGVPQLQVRVRSSRATVLLGLVGVNTLHADAIATATAVTGITTSTGHG
jgi:Flp pilus assembly protein TadG